MLRPLSHSKRTQCVNLLSNIPSSFTQNALFSSSCPGFGRGSINQVTLGGKSILLSRQEININPESKAEVNVKPGQFDDAIEERNIMFQSLAEPIKDPIKQLYEERQLSSQLERERNINNQKQRRSNQGSHKKKMEQTGSNINQKDQFKKSIRENNKRDNDKRQLQQTDFVAKDINWSDFINSSQLDQPTLENKEEEQEALRLELEGGDYDRYLSLPKTIQEKFNFDNNLTDSLQKVVGQNPSYKLSEKKLVYETLLQNLNTPMRQSRKK